MAADIAALAVDKGFDLLRGPVRRVTAPHTPVPFSPCSKTRTSPRLPKSFGQSIRHSKADEVDLRLPFYCDQRERAYCPREATLATAVTMPRLGLTMVEARSSNGGRAGEAVEKGQILSVIESEKVESSRSVHLGNARRDLCRRRRDRADRSLLGRSPSEVRASIAGVREGVRPRGRRGAGGCGFAHHRPDRDADSEPRSRERCQSRAGSAAAAKKLGVDLEAIAAPTGASARRSGGASSSFTRAQ